MSDIYMNDNSSSESDDETFNFETNELQPYAFEPLLDTEKRGRLTSPKTHKSDDPQVRRPTSPMTTSPMSVSATVLEITIKMTRNMELKL